MSFFDNLSNIFDTNSNGRGSVNWKGISEEKDIDDILAASNHKPQVIYKHSPRCGTSYLALRNLESMSAETDQRADFYMVDVISKRSVSAYISERLGIRHESPQLFVIKNEQVIWHGSHYQVQGEMVSSVV